jgi:arginase
MARFAFGRVWVSAHATHILPNDPRLETIVDMDIGVIMVPYDSGHYRTRMGRGPERLLEGGLEPLLRRLGHTIAVEEIEASGSHPAEIATAFELCRRVSDRVRAFRNAGRFPLLLSGNCNIAVGGVAGCGADRTAVAWFDAHGESTTPETTTSGFLDGMGISILVGQCWRTLARRIPDFAPVPAERVLLIGSRDVEPDERELLDRVGVRRVTAIEDIRSAIESTSGAVDGVYVHVDLDVLDSTVAVANAWTSPGGLTIEQLEQAIRELQQHAPVKAVGIASYDPECDRSRGALNAACVAVEAIVGQAN